MNRDEMRYDLLKSFLLTRMEIKGPRAVEPDECVRNPHGFLLAYTDKILDLLAVPQEVSEATKEAIRKEERERIVGILSKGILPGFGVRFEAIRHPHGFGETLRFDPIGLLHFLEEK
jgi:hypothetical protein